MIKLVDIRAYSSSGLGFKFLFLCFDLTLFRAKYTTQMMTAAPIRAPIKAPMMIPTSGSEGHRQAVGFRLIYMHLRLMKNDLEGSQCKKVTGGRNRNSQNSAS